MWNAKFRMLPGAKSKRCRMHKSLIGNELGAGEGKIRNFGVRMRGIRGGKGLKDVKDNPLQMALQLLNHTADETHSRLSNAAKRATRKGRMILPVPLFPGNLPISIARVKGAALDFLCCAADLLEHFDLVFAALLLS